MSDAISWDLQLAIREGRYDEFESLLHEMVESTREEAGTLIYEWFVSEDKSTCHIYERYADDDALMVHIGNFGSKFAERFMGCLEPQAFYVYGAPSETARAALDTLGAVYLGQVGGFSR